MLVKLEYIFLVISILLFLSVLASKASMKLGVPALLLFLIIGMLAGFDGPGGIYFDDAGAAQALGVVALISLLFSGGLDTEWRIVKPVIVSGFLLSTVTVVITTVLTGLLVYELTPLNFNESLLMGAIVSSTDAAAVFSILRSRNVPLRRNVKAVIEFESASNDPMAVFLTLGLIRIITLPNTSWADLVFMFILQMGFGAIIGLAMGRFIPWVIEQINLEYPGLYPVLTIALVLLTYSMAGLIGGNGFLAVYIAGLVMGNQTFPFKKPLLRFHDGLTWLMQIVMFLTLGLLVFPSELVGVIDEGLMIAIFLIVVARPIGVFLPLCFSKFTWREKTMISWVGLRGAVPIILATFPLVQHVPNASMIFNFVFFIVLTSVLIQGTLVPFAARILKVEH